MSSVVTSEGTSLRVLSQVPGVDGLQVGGADGAVQSTVNLFRGDVNLPLPILAMSAPDGLSFALTAYLTSNVQKQVDLSNEVAPTGYLGLGWSLSFEAIAADNPPGRAPDQYTYYLLSGGGANRLHPTGETMDGAVLFEADQFEFWEIRYYRDAERWEIRKEDGTTSVYGGTLDADPSRSMLQYGIKWRDSQGNWSGPTTETNGMSPLVVGWNLAEVRSPFGNALRLEYDNEVRQIGSTAGLYYTSASRLVRVTDPVGNTVTLSYGDKRDDATWREYVVPHYDPSSPDLVAYQDRFETKYLAAVTARGPATALDDAGAVLFRLRFQYEITDVSVDTGPSRVLGKRYLIGVDLQSGDGRRLPGTRFAYYNRQEDRNADAPRGALRQVWYPQGAVATYDYARRTLSGTAREESVEGSGIPAVFWGPDYAVLVHHDDAAQRLTVDAYSWNGRWVRDRLLDDVAVSFDPTTLVVGAQASFFVLAFHTAATRRQLVLRKFTRVRGQFGTFLADDDWTALDIAEEDGTGVVTSGDGFVVAVATGSRPVVTVLDGRTQEWVDRSATLSPSPNGRYALAAYGGNFAFADADVTRGVAALQAFWLDPVELELRPFVLSSSSLDPIFWTESTPYTLLDMGPDLLSATWITKRTEDTVDIALRVQQWDTLFRTTTVVESTRRDVPIDTAAPFAQTTVAVSVVANVDRLWRFDGATWRYAEMVVNGDSPAYAYGDDLALVSTTMDTGIWLFDPYARSWSGPRPPSTRSPLARTLSSTPIPPTATGEVLTVGRDVYRRGADGLLQWLGALDPNLVPSSLANRAPYFIAYEDDARNTRVVPFQNGALAFDKEIVLAGQHIASPDRDLPGTGFVGADALVTYEGDLHDPTAVHLYHYLDFALEGQVDHFSVVRASMDAGLDRTGQATDGQARYTAFAYDDSTVTVAADGTTVEFARAAVIADYGVEGWVGAWPPPAQTPAGQTRSTFHNNRTAVESAHVPLPGSDIASTRYYAFLQGQAVEELELDAAGDERTRKTWSYDVQVSRAPLESPEASLPLYGAWMRTVASETSFYVDPVELGDTTILEGLARGDLPGALTSLLDRSGLALTSRWRLVKRDDDHLWLHPDGSVPHRVALIVRSGRVLASVPIVRRETETYSRQTGLRTRETASYTSTRGEARLQLNESWYAWQVPAYAEALARTHQLALPAVQVQRDAPAADPNGGEVTALTLRTYKDWGEDRWGAVSEYRARSAAMYDPAASVPVRFDAWCPGDPPPPVSEWVPTETVVGRDAITGLVVETRDAMGVPSAQVPDAGGAHVVATVVGASVDAVSYVGFEAYEADGPWSTSDGSPVAAHRVVGDAHTGAASVRLAAGGPSLSASFDWSGTAGPFVVSCWIKTMPGYAGDASWTATAGTSQQIVPLPDTDGRWAFFSFAFDPSFDRTAVVLAVRAGATDVLLDDLFVVPVHAESSAQVYDPQDFAALAVVAPGGQTASTLRDRFGREVVITDADGAVTSWQLRYLARQGMGPDAFGFPAAAPNCEVGLDAADGGSIASLVQGEGWRREWTCSEMAEWEVRDATLYRTSAGDSSITWTSGGDTADRGARVSLVLPVDADGEPVAPTQSVGMSLGAAIEATWTPGRGWVLSVDGAIVSGESGDVVLPAAEWALVVWPPERGRGAFVGFFADGRLLASTRTSEASGGELTLRAGDAGVGFENIATIRRAQLTATFLDGVGIARQEQILTEDGVIASVSCPEGDGQDGIATKKIPIEGAVPQYDDTLVTAIQWPSGVMEGAIARYYSASGPGSDDQGYPYARKVFERAPSRRTIVRSLPGRDFAAIYDGAGDLTNPHVTRIAYVANHKGEFGGDPFPDHTFFVERTTDPNGHVIDVCTDVLGRRVATKTGPVTTGLTDFVVARTELDAAGRPVRVYLPNALRGAVPDARFTVDTTFDFLGNAIRQTTGDTHTTERVFDLLDNERFVLDAVNAARPPGSQVICYRRYDAQSRLIEEGTVVGTWDRARLQGIADDDPSWPTSDDGAAPARKLTYDGDGARVTEIGQLVEAETRTPAAVVREHYEWDRCGRLVRTVALNDGVELTTGFAYDTQNRTTAVRYPSGSLIPEVRYRYDRTGAMDAAGTPSAPESLSTASYTPEGQLASRTTVGGARRVHRTWSYNSPGWTTSIRDQNEDGVTLMEEILQYTSGGYDGTGYFNGQIASAFLSRNAPDASHVERWQLANDGIGRLSVAIDAESPDRSVTGIAYDPNGNLTSWTQQGSTRAWEYDGSDVVRAVRDVETGTVLDTLATDADGRTTASTRLSIDDVDYDPAIERPRSVSWRRDGARELRFGYDSAGARVWKADASGDVTRSVYGPDPAPLLDLHTSGRRRQLVFGPGGVLFACETDGSRVVILVDHLGSIRWVGNEDGSTAAAFDFLPYGALAGAFGPAQASWPYRYTGKALDDTGLYDFGARWYDPWLGRFWTPDPANQFASPYMYAGGQPFDAVDEDGELAFLVVLAIAALAGAAIGGTVNLAMNWQGSSPGQRAAYFFIGAGFGAVAAAASVGLAAATAGLSIAAGVTVSVLAEGALGAVEGYLSNGLNNTVAGRGFNENAGSAALVGGLLGGVTAGLGAAASGLRQGLRSGGRGLAESADRVHSLGYRPRPRPGSPRPGPQGADRFRYVRNSRGRRIWLSRYTTRGSDIIPLVRSATRRNRRVVILSGTHGSSRGGLSPERAFFFEDLNNFRGNRNVRVYDIWRLSDREVRRLVNSDSEVIAAFCYSRENRLMQWAMR